MIRTPRHQILTAEPNSSTNIRATLGKIHRAGDTNLKFPIGLGEMLRAVGIIYVIAGTWLSLYGLNSLWLVYRYLRTRRRYQQEPSLANFPLVTVQLPIYNEIHVIPRLLQAVTNFEYPRNRLQIQVLDDSTDGSLPLLEQLVGSYREQGFDITLIHRQDRVNFKAGALSQGLDQAKGEFLAMFDADFVPAPDWLRKTVPHLVAHPQVGFLQTRWHYLNADYSTVTMAQSIILDAHFMVEHLGRNRSGCLINFNGTAGLWRKACIEDSGGWSGATLTEDLDLSYRAQIGGWQAMYLPDVTVDSELTPQIVAFRSQHFRWAKGATQCLRRIVTPLVRARIPFRARIEGLLHLSGYCAFPLMVLMFILTLPLLWWNILQHLPLAHLTVASLGPPLGMVLSQIVLYRRRSDKGSCLRRLSCIPLVLLFGAGIAASNTRAVFLGLFDAGPSEFVRTPKFNTIRRTDRWFEKSYVMRLPRDMVIDVLCALYGVGCIAAAFLRKAYWAVPFLSIYALGFSVTIGISLWQNFRGQVGSSRSLSSLSTLPLRH